MPYVIERAPDGWRKTHPESERKTSSANTFKEVELSERKQAWAQLIAKVYEGCASQRRTARWTHSYVQNVALT